MACVMNRKANTPIANCQLKNRMLRIKSGYTKNKENEYNPNKNL
jgi:hypothetical protein